MYARILLALTPLLFTLPAHAGECDNATDQASMLQCAAYRYADADKELNALYQQINTRLKDSPDRKKLLQIAQRSWLAFRDTECRFASVGVEGASIYSVIYTQCTTEMTKARVETFKTYLKCPEGDLGCPVPVV